MTEHERAQKVIAAYVAGGGDEAERRRFEKHLAGCDECAAALDEASQFDEKLTSLFMGAVPDAALEDRLVRVVQSLPAPPRSRPARFSGKARALLTAAAAIFLAFLGLLVHIHLDEENQTRSGLGAGGADRVPVAKSLQQTVVETVVEKGSLEETSRSPAEADRKARSNLGAFKTPKMIDEVREQKRPTEGEAKQPPPKDGKGKPDVEGKSSINWAPPVDGASTYNITATVTTSSNNDPILSYSYAPSTGPTIGSVTAAASTSYGGSASRDLIDKLAMLNTNAKAPTGNQPAAPKSDWADLGSAFGNRIQFAPVFETPAKPADTKPASPWNEALARNDPAADFYYKIRESLAPKKVPPAKDPAGLAFDTSGNLYTANPKLPERPSPERRPDALEPPPADPQLRPSLDKNKDKPGEDKKDSKLPGEGPADPKEGQKTPPGLKTPESAKPPAEQQQPPPAQLSRKVIYTAELEFEVDSFDAAVDVIMESRAIAKGSFVSTINKDKLPNGKMRGIVVLRVPPDLLNDLVGRIIKEVVKKGELKNQHLFSEDVTKHYTDLESRLRAARAMEERLIAIIKDGKGVIKDLLQAEKELGIWRGKIEETEGELRYYANLVSLSTLTIKLYERDIKNAAQISEFERIQAGIETEEVEKSFNELKKLAQDTGRVTRTELKRLGGGQFNAVLHFEVPRDQANMVRDRLRQLGNEARLQIDTVQQAADGGAVTAKNTQVVRGDTQFLVSIYNLANMVPRETIIVRLAATDVRKEFERLQGVIVAEKGGFLSVPQINEQDRSDINAQLDFDVRRASVARIESALLGDETLARKQTPTLQGLPVSTGNARFERDDVTDSKVRFLITLLDADSLRPRETRMFRIVAGDVQAAFEKMQQDLKEARVRTRVILSQVVKQDARKVAANFDFSYYRGDEEAVKKALSGAGDILSRTVDRKPDGPDLTDAKVLARVVLVAADAITPRDTFTRRIIAADVAKKYESLLKAIASPGKTRLIKTSGPERGAQEPRGEVQFEVPADMAAAVQAMLDDAGEAVVQSHTRAPDGENVSDARVRFLIEIVDVNSTAILSREIIGVGLAVVDVDSAYDSLLKTLRSIKSSILKQAKDRERNSTAAMLEFNVSRADEAALKEALKVGEVLSDVVVRSQEKSNVTDARISYRVVLKQADALRSRDRITLKVAAVDVNDIFGKLKDAVASVKGRLIDSPDNKDLDQTSQRNVKAWLEFDIPKKDEGVVRQILAGATETLERSVSRLRDDGGMTDSKIGYKIELVSAAISIPPRETTKLVLEVSKVADTLSQFDALVKQVDGESTRPVWGSKSDETATVEYLVPLSAAAGLLEKFRAAGSERLFEPVFDPQAPKGELAKARFQVTLTRDEGLMTQLRQSTRVSLKGLIKSFSWVVAGLMFVGPWLPLAFVVYVVGRRSWRSEPPASEVPVPTVPPAPPAPAEQPDRTNPPS